MAIRDLNRFCGIVLKVGNNVDWTQPPELAFSTNPQPGVIIFSSRMPTVNGSFDGYIYNAENFNPLEIENYLGNWSAASFDHNSLYLSRDIVGVRSMYFLETPSVFCFSNEVKHLLELRVTPIKFSKSAIFKFLFFDEAEVDGDCLFENIHELMPGHFLKLNLKTFEKTVHPYYKTENPEVLEEEEGRAGDFIKDILTSKTEQILSSEVTTGAFLSGGIDSSVIASALYQNGHKGIPFITAVTTEETLNETKYAASVVRQFGLTNWHQIEVAGIENELENMHYVMEFPTLSLGSFMQYELFRFAKFLGLEQVFDGTGADALFAGHLYYKAIYWNTLMKSGKWRTLSKELKKYRGANTFWLSFYLRMMAKYKVLGKLPPGMKYKILLRQNVLLKYLNPDFIDVCKDTFEIKRSRNMKDLNDFLTDDFYGGSVKRLLRFPDRMGKHFGVMNLSVFSDDKDLFEHALTIAPNLKIRNDQLKYILRYAFRKELPMEILNRDDKMGLIAPNNAWLKEHKSLFLSYFDESLSPFFEVEQMKEALSHAIDHAGAQEDYKIFKFISFAIWHKVFSEKYKQ